MDVVYIGATKTPLIVVYSSFARSSLTHNFRQKDLKFIHKSQINVRLLQVCIKLILLYLIADMTQRF